MRTIKLTLEFDGTAYVGWQRQTTGISIQQLLEEALARVLEEPVTVTGSGRTDAGVHARGLVAHLRTSKQIPLRAFRDGVNRFLPPDVAVRSAEEAPERFHARHDAEGKWYRYTLQTGPVRAPLTARQVWHLRPPLDLSLMRAAAARLTGRHDYAAFRSAHCDAKTTERNIHAISLLEEGELIRIDVRGDGFMRHMVRILVGTLVEIGLHKRPIDDIDRLLAGTAGLRAGMTAPPQGLCLMEVYYPPLT